MNYYLDTEFFEGVKQRKVLGVKIGKPIPTIDLISIAIVSEDGRKFFALNKDCELKHVWKDEWLRKNVLAPIYRSYYCGDIRNHIDFTLPTMRSLFKRVGLGNWELQEAIVKFVGGAFHYQASCSRCGYWEVERNKPVFYADYADYDWVVFCQIFGRMNDLPKGFPMYCIDLKQEMDRLGAPDSIKPQNLSEHDALADAQYAKALHEVLLTQYPQVA